MDPTTNPGAQVPPQPDLGQTVYFPPVGQGQPPAGAPVYGNGYTAGQPQQQAPAQPQGQNQGQQQPTYNPLQEQGPVPSVQPQPGQPYYGPHYGGPRGQWAAGHPDRNRSLWGLILVGAGVLFLIDQLFSFNGFGSVVLLGIGGAFMYAYYNMQKWAVIPGSILLGLGVGTLLQDLDFMNFWGGGITAFALGLGFCLTWFLERRHWWALIPGGILVLAGLSSASVFGRFWPILLIALGVYLLYEQSRRQPTR